MENKTLLIFAKRIFSTSSVEKAKLSLTQLKMILEEQGAPQSDIHLLDEMINSAHEMKQMSDKQFFTDSDIKIAARRAEERRRREMEARNRGRC